MIRSIIIDSLVQLIVEHGLRSLMILFRSPTISFIPLDILTNIGIVALKIVTYVFVQMLLFNEFLLVRELAGELNVVLFEV